MRLPPKEKRDSIRVDIRSQVQMVLLSLSTFDASLKLLRSERHSRGERGRLRVRNEIVEVGQASSLLCLCACAHELAISSVNQSASLISAGPLGSRNFLGRSM